MRIRRPSVRITPEDVLLYCKKRGQRPTLEQAESWLHRQKSCIQGMMNNVIQNNLTEILDEATLREYPDPRFNQRYKAIDEAVFTAADAYAQSLGLDYYGSNHTERDMIEVVRRLLVENGEFTACFLSTQEFGKPFKDLVQRVVTHRTERMHITCRENNVKAELVAKSICEHGHDTFVPEKLSKLH